MEIRSTFESTHFVARTQFPRNSLISDSLATFQDYLENEEIAECPEVFGLAWIQNGRLNIWRKICLLLRDRELYQAKKVSPPKGETRSSRVVSSCYAVTFSRLAVLSRCRNVGFATRDRCAANAWYTRDRHAVTPFAPYRVTATGHRWNVDGHAPQQRRNNWKRLEPARVTENPFRRFTERTADSDSVRANHRLYYPSRYGTDTTRFRSDERSCRR